MTISKRPRNNLMVIQCMNGKSVSYIASKNSISHAAARGVILRIFAYFLRSIDSNERPSIDSLKNLNQDKKDMLSKYLNGELEIGGDIDKYSNLSRLGISVRSMNCLMSAKIRTIDDLMNTTYEDLIKIRNMGKKSIEEIREAIEKYKLSSSGDSILDSMEAAVLIGDIFEICMDISEKSRECKTISEIHNIKQKLLKVLDDKTLQ